MWQSKPKQISPYFDYHPLQDGWIRLLAVENATDASEIGEQLKIHFYSSPLSTCPPYTALSYTWGDPSPTIDPRTIIFTKVLLCYPVLCQNRIVLASRNLRDALRRIRQYQTWRANGEGTFERYDEPDQKILLQRTYGATVYFWIDALCINQDDIHERSRQVTLMSRIYTQANHTMVWLGESDKYTEVAQSFLGKVARNAGVEVSTSMGYMYPSVERIQGYTGLKDLDTDEQVAFLAIMARNWFFRMWVLQECVLSRRLGVLLGDLCFNYQLLLHAAHVECVYGRDYNFAKTAFATSKKHPEFASSVLSERVFNSTQKLVFTGHLQERVASGHLPDFLSAITASRSLIATDPRDKIYALLGIVSEFQCDDVSMPVPDYTKPIEHVFIETTYSVMQARKDLAVISLASTQTAILNLPSWCPDYSSNASPLKLFEDAENTWLSGAAWAHTPRFELLPDMKLRVEGKRIDVVVESTSIGSTPVSSSESPRPDRLRFGIAEMCAMVSKVEVRKHRNNTLQDQSRMQILWRTMILDKFQGVSPADGKLGALFPEFIKWLLMAIVNHHLERSETRNRNLLSKTELNRYVEKLISCLEMLVALDPLDAMFVPDSTQLRAILETSNARQSNNADDMVSAPRSENIALQSTLSTNVAQSQDDTAGYPFLTSALDNSRNQSSKASTREALDKSFVSAFLPLMHANMARLRHSTLGLANASILPSDEVWILHGAPAPVFLRPTSCGRYQYLGDAYVHGIMHDGIAPICGELVPVVLE